MINFSSLKNMENIVQKEHKPNIVERSNWLYPDRGMVKWMGWILSDHQSFMDNKHLNISKQQSNINMCEYDVNKEIIHALQERKDVSIQLNVLENGNFTKLIKGLINGVDEGKIFLLKENGDLTIISIDSIKNIEIESSTKWWLHDYNSL